MTSRSRAAGGNLIFASILATLSYLPFELVAKFTLIVCVVFFILDPFPVSRIVAVAGKITLRRLALFTALHG